MLDYIIKYGSYINKKGELMPTVKIQKASNGYFCSTQVQGCKICETLQDVYDYIKELMEDVGEGE